MTATDGAFGGDLNLGGSISAREGAAFTDANVDGVGDPTESDSDGDGSVNYAEARAASFGGSTAGAPGTGNNSSTSQGNATGGAAGVVPPDTGAPCTH